MKHKSLIIFAIVFVLGIFLFVITRNPMSQLPPSKPLVVTSFYPLYFFASEIAGTLMDVENLTPAGIEPHEYEPTANDLRMLEKSQVVILNGGGLEAWGDNIKSIVDPKKTSVIRLLNAKATDPHFWLSPLIAKQMTTEIAHTMISADPAHEAEYTANAKALSTKLDTLDQDYKTGLATCTRRDFITSHNAFGYIASTYNLSQVPIAGLSPEAEPSPKQLAEIATFVRIHGVEVIFFESLTSPKFSETIAKETRARTMVLDPIEGIPEDARASGEDYFTLMRTNLANLREALHCTP